MKAISLWQPWATLIAIRAKIYETRSWTTSYRGPLLIHAAKRFDTAQRQLCHQEPFARYLIEAGYDLTSDLPRGAYVAVVELVEICPTVLLRGRLGPDELAFGDYSPGRFAWKMENVRIFPESVPARGYQGLWNPLEGVGQVTVALIKKQLEVSMSIPNNTPTAKTCPACRPTVRLVVRTNGETGEQFLGCAKYPECKYTEPLTEDIKMQLMGASRLPGF